MAPSSKYKTALDELEAIDIAKFDWNIDRSTTAALNTTQTLRDGIICGIGTMGTEEEERNFEARCAQELDSDDDMIEADEATEIQSKGSVEKQGQDGSELIVYKEKAFKDDGEVALGQVEKKLIWGERVIEVMENHYTLHEYIANEKWQAMVVRSKLSPFNKNKLT